MNNHSLFRGTPLRRNLLTAALVAGLGTAGLVHGQATTGTIFGQAPAGSGDTVAIRNSSGITRQVAVDAQGRYSIAALPLGTYTVSLLRDGKEVDSRSNVTLRVGAGTEVSFVAAADAGQAKDLSAVEVTASALPAIDVTGVDSRTVITSEQLARLPLARSAEAIALLAPGVVEGSGYFGGPTGGTVVSFGGSSVTENAYYINGFNTTDPLSNFGGFTLPYGSIDQQEILSGGYGAAYGRSDGGVISQVGKRGTNEWHFGGQVLWTPAFARGEQRDIHYVSGADRGTLYDRNSRDRSWTTVVSAYAGGPLIKDKLFLFASAEAERREGSSIGSTDSPYKTNYRNDYPKWYAKLDWNITESNILEVTGASSKRSYSADRFNYDYDTGRSGAPASPAVPTKAGADMYVAKFTSYITDDLTLSALYGRMDGTYYNQVTNRYPDIGRLYSTNKQNPALNGGSPIVSPQTLGEIADPTHTSRNTNLRIDLSYRLGDHTLSAGIDNQTIKDMNDGTRMADPGYAWEYNVGNPSTPIKGAPGDANYVAAPGGYAGGETGYYVAKYRRYGGGSVRVEQRAQYVEDSWQVNDRWLLKLGLRNDQFTNYNPNGQSYLRLTKPQWAPRVGFSWDVNGDSSFKIYGNAGRYFLALPSTVAMRQAGAPLYTREYFTYTGIDSNGQPTGLTPVDTSRGVGAPISDNREYGQSHDPKMVTATNLKSEYQDEFILGFDKKLGNDWVYGAKATYRNLRTAIDDFGDSGAVAAKMDRMGIDRSTYDADQISGAYLFNPGRTNILKVQKYDGSYYSVPMTTADFGFSSGIKRHYYGLNLFLEHPFDGTWSGKIDYLFSRSYGNSEGQVRSDIGQEDVSATVDWDYAQVMEYANGELSNSRRHQLKAYGSYQIAPEWLLSGNVAILSGAPRSCLGYYGPGETNPGLGYSGGYYHWCGGKVSRPGDAGHNPWQYIVSLSAEYRPEWAGKKLGINVMVYNVLNNRVTTQTDPFYGSTGGEYPSYRIPVTQSQPRYVRFGVTYDF
ncbi:Oar protein [Frateuria sp. Soil773]|uniref:TonB-dependent receptor n=1 Tax=Frateuria sp. Soil773 TaxID=1736407 RepID=UPI0006F808BC|nr:TonB-dependent receptor [Frateuria sp. Soil773]KRE88367.1 Oar protein [Frateuria sp. Soil773]